MADIKSAKEIAMEKLASLGEATEEERLEWKFLPEGEKLAARYLKDDVNIVSELSQQPENGRKYVTRGAIGILVRNISLPRNDFAKKNNKKAMDGLKTVMADKVAVENTLSKIRRIFEHYSQQGAQQKRQAFESLKMDFTAKVRQAMQQQGMPASMKIDVERQPQFQEEWARMQNQLDAQYVKLLDEYKQELLSVK
ncbi:MAG: hypothetical protein PHR56_05020 [Dehalococcoidales bacterium]|nr:hypothetical protein [Dehalococcoidales bacterium]